VKKRVAEDRAQKQYLNQERGLEQEKCTHPARGKGKIEPKGRTTKHEGRQDDLHILPLTGGGEYLRLSGPGPRKEIPGLGSIRLSRGK